MIGVVSLDDADDFCFRPFVDFRNEIAFFALFRLNGAHFPDTVFQEFPGLFCCFDGDVEHVRTLMSYCETMEVQREDNENGGG